MAHRPVSKAPCPAPCGYFVRPLTRILPKEQTRLPSAELPFASRIRYPNSSTTHAAQKPHNRLNPPIKVRQMKLLVRRMKIVVRQPKTHHHRRRLQLPHKVPHIRNRPSPPHKHRLLPEHR